MSHKDRCIRNFMVLLAEDRIPPPPELALESVPMRLVPVKCPECGKVYTRAIPGSGVEVACRGCKVTSVVFVSAA